MFPVTRPAGAVNACINSTRTQAVNMYELDLAIVCVQVLQHAHLIPIVDVGKRGAYHLVHGDLSRQHSFRTTLRFNGPVPVDSRP